ncbi:MAG TPA: methionine--tRNA ligase [Streptosporangiaceae bacterium]|jgi:methionyl-tRNA synthetase
MTAERIFLSTAIPYVNSRPHLGHALELVQADVLARHLRQVGNQVRFQTGTDDNALKNVLAADAENVSVTELVERNATAFERLRGPLALSFDDFIRTSSDPRHRAGVETLWRACAASGDFYRRHYEGLYCVGCEQFYQPGELQDGRCPEHGTAPQRVAEENWFFRLSRYSAQLHELISSGRLRIEPQARRNEVLSFIAAGLQDFSVSRPAARARGWGITVPGDQDQVIYVWWDALGNYVTAPGYGSDPAGYQRWWAGAARRVHVIGKGVLRFHAVYWPAILLSAGEPLPTEILVHDYLTIDGQKISKSAAGHAAAADPVALTDRYGTDAVRWWLVREVPRSGDADFTAARLVARANDELANGIGNLVSRVVSLVHRYRAGRVPQPEPGPDGRDQPPGAADAAPLLAACRAAPDQLRAALDGFDFRAASAAAWAIAEQANRYVERTEPWHLARAEQAGDAAAGRRLDTVLAVLVAGCGALAAQLAPFVPGLAGQITAALDDSAGALPARSVLFPRLEADGRFRGKIGEPGKLGNLSPAVRTSSI